MNRIGYILFILLVACACMSAASGTRDAGRDKRSAAQQAGVIHRSSMALQQLARNAGTSFAAFLRSAGSSPNGLRSSSAAGQSGNLLKSPLQNRPLSPDVQRTIQWNKQFGTPRSIDYSLPELKNKPVSTGPSKNMVALARQFLAENKTLLKIADPSKEFKLIGSSTDEKGYTHVRFQQQYKGLDVWAKDAYVHLDEAGRVASFNGAYASTPGIDVSTRVSKSEAVSAASADVRHKGYEPDVPASFRKMFHYSGPHAKKVIWYDEMPKAHLAWFVEIRSGVDHDLYYFVDAGDGTILSSYDNVAHDGPASGSGTDLNGVTRNFGTYLLGGTYFMIDASQSMYDAAHSTIPDNPVGALVALDLRNKDLSAQSQIYFVSSATNVWTDASTISAIYNAGITYNYYKNRFNRNSINDSGMTIYSVVHVTSNSQPMDNAFWNGYFMAYGDGNQVFKPLAGGLDVASHEMTHGVTQHSAGLEYKDQSGALNESMSDVMAVSLDSANWAIGETVVKDLVDYPTGNLRDLADPHNGGTSTSACWQPAKLSEIVNTSDDNGGVHTNSGIPNHAYYLVATSIGRQEASHIWYKALTAYLTRSSQFADARVATVDAAKELFGPTSVEVTAVKNGWDGVEVLDSVGTPPPPGTHLVGDNYLLLTNTAISDPNSIYMAQTNIISAGDYAALTQTPVLTKPAVSDNGQLVCFVDGTNRLRALNTNPGNPQEQYVDTNRVWWSVAIGPGLSSIALTSIYVDTSIYYFDISSNQSKVFKIVTQAYDAPDTKTALFADALSFDPTGRYLLFDAFNQVVASSGDTIHYWNIGILDVTTGQMATVLPPQPQGVNFSNPSFSKTRQDCFAFDYWNENSGEGYVLAANFNTGESGVVAGPQTVPGLPSYSAMDDTIAYHTVSAGHDAVNKMPLLADRITGSGIPQTHSVDATFPVWFVIGTRVTDARPTKTLPATARLFQNFPNPFNPSTKIEYDLATDSHVTLAVFDVLGQEVRTLVDAAQFAGSHEIEFNAGGLPSGMYFYILRAGTYSETRKLVLLK